MKFSPTRHGCRSHRAAGASVTPPNTTGNRTLGSLQNPGGRCPRRFQSLQLIGQLRGRAVPNQRPTHPPWRRWALYLHANFKSVFICIIIYRHFAHGLFWFGNWERRSEGAKSELCTFLPSIRHLASSSLYDLLVMGLVILRLSRVLWFVQHFSILVSKWLKKPADRKSKG